MDYRNITPQQKKEELERLKADYQALCQKGLKLDMSRGKPSAEQLKLSEGLLTVLSADEQTVYEGTDCRNYGGFDGIPAMKKLFGELLDLPVENIFVGGVSSLQLMFDTISRHMLFGAYPGATPWASQGKIRFLCPCPGYDRHFAISEIFGMELIPIKMTSDGPDMEEVAKWVENDSTVKGIWCVPKYANPTGVTYSDETVKRFAKLNPAAPDFRIFWDNAYAVHDLYDETEPLLNIYTALAQEGKENMAYIFTSFSKITYAGGSVSMFASGKDNMAFAKKIIGKQTIGYDKLNQLRHILYFQNAEGVYAQMKKHGALLRPKFEAVTEIFEKELGTCGIGSWSKPKGGYFISLDLPAGTAKRTYELCKNAGIVLTKVGDTFPYGVDPADSNLRIAPSLPPKEELIEAAEALCLCARIATLEKC